MYILTYMYILAEISAYHLQFLMATPTSKKSLSSQKKITCGNTSFKGSSTAKPETKRGTKKHEQQTQRCDICLEAIEEAIGIIIQGKTPFCFRESVKLGYIVNVSVFRDHCLLVQWSQVNHSFVS